MKQKKPTEIYSKKTGLLSKYYGLSESDKEYLNNFENFTQGNADLGKSSDFFEKNSGYSSLASYRKDIDSGRQKDLMTRGNSIDIDPTDPSFGPAIIDSFRSQAEYCGRCIKPEHECKCDEVKRKTPYSEDDWRQTLLNDPQEAYGELMSRHTKAYDLLPTGNAPQDLPEGTMVLIAIPRHSLRGKLAQIVSKRAQDGKYEVIVHSTSNPVRGYFSANELKVSRRKQDVRS